MMKIKLSILLLFFSLKLCAQSPWYDSLKTLQLVDTYGSNNKNARFRGSIIIPTDTIKMARKDSGAIAYKANILWSWNGFRWNSSGNGSGTSTQNLQQVTNNDSTTTTKITASNFNASQAPTFATNADAIAGNLINGDIYKLPFSAGNYLLAIVSILGSGLLSESGSALLTESNSPILTN